MEREEERVAHSPRKMTGAVRLRPPINRRGLIYALLAIGVAIIFLLELMIGPVRIPFADVLQALTGGHASRLSWDRIVLFARFPRALNAVVSGAALGTCGLLLQTMFRNPLADPYVLGTASGAALGAAVAILLPIQLAFVEFGLLHGLAFAGALLAALVVFRLGGTGGPGGLTRHRTPHARHHHLTAVRGGRGAYR